MVTISSGLPWYLAQIKPNSHRIAERNLDRQGFASFLPMQVGTERVRGQFKEAVRPLFPGYIFLQLDPETGPWQKINATKGVTRLVCFGASPAQVPSDLVDQILQRCDAQSVLKTPTPLAPGDRVTVTGGPFADFVATVDAMVPEQRVWVLLDMMGRKTRVAMDAKDLQSAR